MDNENSQAKKSSVKSKQKTEAQDARIKELENQLARAVADYRNLEKRVEDEKRETVKYANKELLMTIIPAFDTLFLAEKYIEDEGIKLTVKHLSESLKNVGVERIEAVGKDFDAGVMEAVTTDTGAENQVLEELRPGFMLNGKVIRPAQVKVGKGEN